MEKGEPYAESSPRNKEKKICMIKVREEERDKRKWERE